MQGLVKNRLTKFIVENDLFCSDQHGFVRGKSCTTNLLETLDIVTKSLSEGKAVNVVYLDYLKAFDMVLHKRLIHKLRSYGLEARFLRWTEAFLTGRSQRVVLGDAMFHTLALGARQRTITHL